MSDLAVYGDGHLAATLEIVLGLRGFKWSDQSTLALVAHDVVDHSNAVQVLPYFKRACAAHEYVVVVSQVPPGWTRAAADGRQGVFYQVDTIIVRRAVERMLRPEQFIVGCADPAESLPLVYQQYLAAYECPVLQMSYESAELAKCAINYMLAAQIMAANELAAAAVKVDANYADVERALRGEARIGPHAYLRPGKLNQHLRRDVDTVRQLADLPASGELEREVKILKANLDEMDARAELVLDRDI